MNKYIDKNNDKPTDVKCKNCGCTCTSRYCPDCGQSVEEKRIDNKTFFISIIAGLTRINKGFLFTAWNLLIRPWRVIRDYIQCRRVRYVAPISMLIFVCFINAFISAFVMGDDNAAIGDMKDANAPVLYKMLLSVGHFLMTNALAQNLTVYLPAIMAIPIVYGRVGAKRYNMAEYLTAMIYMASAFIIFDTITLPIFTVSQTVYSGLGFCYTILMCAIGMYIAFPIGTRKRRISYFIMYLITVLLIYMILFVMIGLIIGLSGTAR